MRPGEGTNILLTRFRSGFDIRDGIAALATGSAHGDYSEASTWEPCFYWSRVPLGKSIMHPSFCHPCVLPHFFLMTASDPCVAECILALVPPPSHVRPMGSLSAVHLSGLSPNLQGLSLT